MTLKEWIEKYEDSYEPAHIAVEDLLAMESLRLARLEKLRLQLNEEYREVELYLIEELKPLVKE